MKTKDIIKIDPTAAALAEALRLNPRESAAAATLTDRLQECGASATAARKAVKAIALAALPVASWPKRELNRLLRGTSVKDIQTRLNLANGRRRERTVDLSDALRACVKARADAEGFYWAAGATVANSYGYRAYRTAFIVAVRSDGTLRVMAGQVSANKGSSPTNQLAGLTVRATADDWRAWADQTIAMTPIPTGDPETATA